MEEDAHKYDGRHVDMEDHSRHKPEPNVIRSAQSDDEDEDTLLNNHPAMQRPGLHYEHNEEFKNYGREGVRFVEMNVDEFGVAIRTKRDLYTVLTVEAQKFLPSQDSCTLKFLMDIMQGHKDAFYLNEIKHVCVPRLDEFNASEIYNMAMNNPEMRRYIPEPQEGDKSGARTVSCKFLFTSKSLPNGLPEFRLLTWSFSREHHYARVLPPKNQTGTPEAQEQRSKEWRPNQVQDPQRHVRDAP